MFDNLEYLTKALQGNKEKRTYNWYKVNVVIKILHSVSDISLVLQNIGGDNASLYKNIDLDLVYSDRPSTYCANFWM